MNKEDNNQGEMPSQHGESVVTDLKCFTSNEMCHAMKYYDYGEDNGQVYKGWIDKTTYSLSEDKTALPVTMK